MKKYTIVLLLSLSLCSNLCFGVGKSNVKQGVNLADYNVQSMEYALASRFELIRVEIELVREFTEMTLDLFENDNEDIDMVDTEEIEDTYKRRVINPALYSLKGLVKNPYAGALAQEILTLLQMNRSEECFIKFDELHCELHADLKIANSLGIEISGYEREMQQAATERLMLMVLMAGINDGQ